MQPTTSIRTISIVFSIAVLALYVFVPYLSGTQYLIHDFLNSNVVWYKVLDNSGLLFSDSLKVIDSLLTGVPRGCFPSELSLTNLIFQYLPLKGALFVNHLIIHTVAFIGMIMLLRLIASIWARSYPLDSYPLVYLLALAFSLLPFWTPAGLSVAGQPLIVYALILLFKEQKVLRALVILGLIPFYSSFIFTTAFILIEAGLVCLILVVVNRRLYPWLLLGLTLLACLSVVSEYRLFFMQFVEQMPSHRIAMENLGSLNYKGFIGVSVALFFKGQYHAHSHAFPYLLIAVLFLLVMASRIKYAIIIVAAMIIQLIFTSFLNLRDWDLIAQNLPPDHILQVLQLRFYTVLPIFWHLLFFLSILVVRQRFRKSTILGAQLLILLLVFLRVTDYKIVDYQGSQFNDNRFYATIINPQSNQFKTLDDYYHTKMFDSFRELVESNKTEPFKIACFDIEPQIAQMNGFKTIGGYFPYFPLESKMNFIEMVKTEYRLSNPKYLHQIEKWGSQCYFLLDDSVDCPEPNFNFDLMKAHGADFILSRSELCLTETELMSTLIDPIDDSLFYIYIIK